MIRRFFRHIREGFLGVIRHFGMAISSASAVTITLILVGFFLMLTLNLASLTSDIESSISLTAIISYDVNDSQVSSIRKEIERIEYVSSATYRTSEEEFNYYCELYPEITDFNELYRDRNPFHNVFLVKVNDTSMIQSVKAKIEKVNGIDSVEDGGSNTYTLVSILSSARYFGGALIIALCVLAVYLVYNTIRITIASRDDEISIMRNVGARNSYIRAPFLVEGIIIGILGSLIPVALMLYSYVTIFKKTEGILFGVFKLIDPNPFILYLCGGLLGVAVLVGFLGSYISVCKHLRLHR